MNKIIVEIRLLAPEKAKKMKATAKICFQAEFGEIMINGFRIIETEPQKPWVAPPSDSYTKEGKVYSKPIIELSPRAKQEVYWAILEAYKTLEKSSEVSFRP